VRIRSELIYFFLIISVLPLSAVIYLSYDYGKVAIRDSVMSNLQGATENTGNAIDNWMNARKDDMRIISESKLVFNGNEEFQNYLKSFQKEYSGVYNEFFILDLNGNIIFSNNNQTGNELDKSYFVEAMKGRLYISDVYLSENKSSPEIIIADPIKKNGSIIGIMAARVSIENLYRIIESIDIGNSGEVFIVNSKGFIIFHKNRSKILQENIRNNVAVKEVTYEKNGITEYVNDKGVKVVGSYYWLPLYRWGLIVEQNTDDAYEGITLLGKRMVGISFFSALAVIFMAIIISNRITGPINSLENGAVGLVKGNFKPVPLTSKNEIGNLTEIFNKTAEELILIRKKLENKIEIANKDLEEKNKELTRAYEELKKVDELKSDFISLVSHELKTPLSIIRIATEYLESENDLDPSAKNEMIQLILKNIDRQTKLINDILDLSKIEAGKTEFHLEPLDIHEIVKSFFETAMPLANKKNITVSTNIPEKLSLIWGDREKLIIVINNLLDNALKFTPSGGSIQLSVKDDIDSIEVRMKDTGIGI
jgi:signal transduction histidine kinase